MTPQPRTSPFLAALIGGAAGLIVMFFPPHFITLFFAPFVGGVVGGLRSRASPTESFIIGPTIGSLLTVMVGVALVIFARLSTGETGAGGMGGMVTQALDNMPLIVAALGGLWVYATMSGCVGALVGGWLTRMN